MSKPLRVPLDNLTPGVRQLTGAVARYVTRVHRLGPGERLLFFDPTEGTEAEARLLRGSSTDVYCELEAVRPSGYRALPISLLQGLAKADKPDDVIRDATALGVARVVLVQMERSVARPTPERSAARLERWKRIAIDAARQSGRGNIPAIVGPLGLGELLPGLTEDRRIVLSPNAPPLFESLRPWREGEFIALLVGPEGGLSALELELAETAGFTPASLGATTLRTELAGVAALGALVALNAARALC